MALTNNLNKSTSRGVRNNNPLNLRKTNTSWLGKINNPTENAFEGFQYTWQGVRAGVLDITNDIAKGTNTIEKLINQFAPPTENNTKNYIDVVAKTVGIPKDRVILKNDYQLFLKLIPAMIVVENGATEAKKVSTEDIQKGINEAFKYRGYKTGTIDKKNIIPQAGNIISVFAIIAGAIFLAKLFIK